MDEKIFRVLDANFNRAKEGLRVCEDVSRFVCDQAAWTRSFKDVRHSLTDIQGSLNRKAMLKNRDIISDVGKRSSETEFRRKDVRDIFFANIQRVKESIRVLEEFMKLLNKKQAQELKAARYQIYDLERKTHLRIVIRSATKDK